MKKLIEHLGRRDFEIMTPSKNTAVVYIDDIEDKQRQQDLLSQGWGQVIDLTFDDAAFSEEQVIEWGEHLPRFYRGFFTKAQAKKLLHFLEGVFLHADNINNVVVRCEDGRSRSAAVVQYCQHRFDASAVRDVEYPNTLVVKLLNNPATYDETFKAALAKADQIKALKEQGVVSPDEVKKHRFLREALHFCALIFGAYLLLQISDAFF